MSDQQEWSTPGGLVVMAWVLAVAALAWFVLLRVAAADAPGQLLAAVATIGLGLAALSGTRARPRLSAGPDGLTVRRLTWSLHVPWSRVDGIRVLRTRRLGRETSLLELDLRTAVDDGERLVVLGRLELGEDPEEVAEALHARLG
ncbi:PH domain-containing protein [Pseudonocardia endophytica]|nr:PH domain-containing protein [Pseudonocardia endophytica]